MTQPESGEQSDGSRRQAPPAVTELRLAAAEIARLVSLGDDALHEEMDRNWLAPSDPDIYAIWMRLFELGLGDVFLKYTSATPDDVEEINLRFELEAEGVTDEDEVESRLDEFRERRTPFGERLLAGDFPQPHSGEIPELLSRLVQRGLTDVAQALPLEILKSILWHETCSNTSGEIPRSPDDRHEPLWPPAWRAVAAEYCRRMRAELVSLSGDSSGQVAADLIRRVLARSPSV